MPTGHRYPPSQGDSYVIEFTSTKAGGETKTFSSATTTLLSAYWVPFGDSDSTGHTKVAIPFPCRIASVSFVGEHLANTDEQRIRVLKYLQDANATGANVISNYTGSGSIVNYFRSVATTANQPVGEYWVDPEVDYLSSNGSRAEGFYETTGNFTVGDYLSCSIQSEAGADSVSHLHVFVTLMRTG